MLFVYFQSTATTTAVQATKTAHRLAKPNDSEAAVLRKLFPASAAGKRSFDPTSASCSSSAQKKKKAANASGRPMNIQVVMLDGFTPNLPRGKSRTALKEGRIETLCFRRSMTPLEVRNQVIQGFRQLADLESWTVLDCTDNHLSVAKEQVLNGEDVVKRKGCLYLCQKQPKVCRNGMPTTCNNMIEFLCESFFIH